MFIPRAVKGRAPAQRPLPRAKRKAPSSRSSSVEKKKVVVEDFRSEQTIETATETITSTHEGNNDVI